MSGSANLERLEQVGRFAAEAQGRPPGAKAGQSRSLFVDGASDSTLPRPLAHGDPDQMMPALDGEPGVLGGKQHRLVKGCLHTGRLCIVHGLHRRAPLCSVVLDSNKLDDSLVQDVGLGVLPDEDHFGGDVNGGDSRAQRCAGMTFRWFVRRRVDRNVLLVSAGAMTSAVRSGPTKRVRPAIPPLPSPVFVR